jgi:multisubunit Na+/H+ antiporter MnhG subunit
VNEVNVIVGFIIVLLGVVGLIRPDVYIAFAGSGRALSPGPSCMVACFGVRCIRTILFSDWCRGWPAPSSSSLESAP